MEKINVIGAGLAGVEASLYLANAGYKVFLYEQKPIKKSPAHHSNNFAELVCSNSLKSKKIDNACGLLKYEMEKFDSIMMEASKESEVPAGNALSVDRDLFSTYITKKIRENPNITVIEEEVTELKEGINIIATGPLTSDGLSKCISSIIGEDNLYFYDAAAPIIEASSINMNIAFKKARYDQGDDSYINCPFTKEQYDNFYNELINAQIANIHEFDKVFEGCMPIEVMAKRGKQTLLFGPLKPKGLAREGFEKPYAVVQLRQDDAAKTLYNLVGFQTHLAFPEQKRVFSLIPGLENVEFVKYGRMHKNTYLNSPQILYPTYQTKKYAIHTTVIL